MSYLPNAKRYEGRSSGGAAGQESCCRRCRLGLWQNFGGADVFETGRAVIRRAFDRGVTHFDLANNYGPPYGSAEENFGAILRKDFRGHRNELMISSKAGWDMWPGPYGVGGSRKYLLASLDESLKRMGLEYVDIFYSHRPLRMCRWKRRWARWCRRCARERRCMWASRRTARSERARRPDSEGRRRAAADSSAVVLDAEPMDRKGVAGDAG